MEPGVPFALLGTGLLLAVAAWTALAAVALVGLRRPGGRLPGLLVLAGALVLAGVETTTALSFGDRTSDTLSLLRAAGGLLLAGGLVAGALADDGVRRRVPDALPLAGVVVPLGAAPAPGLLAGAALLAAALASVRQRADLPGRLLALGLLVAAASAAAAPLADDDAGGATTVVVLRLVAAVVLLAALVGLARRSLLGKVVAAIVGGVLVMAGSAVGVVGTVVVDRYQQQASSLVEQEAESRLVALLDRLDQATLTSQVAQDACVRQPARCDASVQFFDGRASSFAALVTRGQAPRALGGATPLSAPELLGLSSSCAVRVVLERDVACGATSTATTVLPTTVRLTGAAPSVAQVVVRAGPRPRPTDPPTSVFVYGLRLDDAFAAQSSISGGYSLSVLIGEQVASSNLSGSGREVVRRIAVGAGVPQRPERRSTVAAEGTSPTVAFRPLDGADGPSGVLAVSREAAESLAAQREALRALFLTSLLATLVVGGIAVLLGRRTVDPVRRLTAVAERIGAGELVASAGVRSRDEVGTLSRTFDAMTASLGKLTGDLRASAARLETVLSSMSDGLVATDADGTVSSANPAALSMAGLDDEAHAVGRPLREVLDVRDPAGAQLADPSLRLADAVAEVHRADGTTVPVRMAISPLESGDGVVLVLRDTTREREVERMKTEFLSNVSHELRTPLTPIRGYADLLVSRSNLTPKQVGTFATTILAESIKMNRVVDLLVDVAALEAGRVTVTPRAVTAKDLVEGRLVAWRDRQPERAADLKRRVSAGLPPLMVDPTWVGKALDELVDNALKYTAPGTAVTLGATAGPDERTVRVFVRDAGPGIAEADQATLFTSFEQVDGSATRRVGGLGLGLSFVRRLSDDAGFPLTVSSELGVGSEFALDLPVSDTPPAPKARRRAAVRKAVRPRRTTAKRS